MYKLLQYVGLIKRNAIDVEDVYQVLFSPTTSNDLNLINSQRFGKTFREDDGNTWHQIVYLEHMQKHLSYIDKKCIVGAAVQFLTEFHVERGKIIHIYCDDRQIEISSILSENDAPVKRYDKDTLLAAAAGIEDFILEQDTMPPSTRNPYGGILFRDTNASFQRRR